MPRGTGNQWFDACRRLSGAGSLSAAAMLLCVICWSTSGLFIKLIDWHPLVISGARSGIAALFMAAVHGRAMFCRSASAPRFLGVNVLFLAAITSAATKILFVTANKMTSPASAIALQHTAPVWAAIAGAALLGERPRPAQWLAVAMACCGIGAFFFDSLESGRLAGNAVALLCGASFALSMIALRSLKEGSPALALFYSHLITAALGLPAMLAAPPLVTAANTGAVLFLGFVQIGGASLLYAYAIRRLPAVNAILIAQLEPVLNPLWIFMFSGELPARYAIFGGVLVIASVLVANKGMNPANAAPEDAAAGDVPRFFPMFVSLAGKRVLVIGGGNIALRRVRGLLQFGCYIHVIAEKPDHALEAAALEHQALISLERRSFCPGDCGSGAGGGRPCLVIAATDKRAVNHAAAEECALRGIPVSVADCKEESTFYFPAIVTHGTIVAGVSSGGENHGAARDAAAKIRAVLETNDAANRRR